LNENTRATDSVYRYWWEEFVIILPNTDQFWAFQVAEKLRKAISEEPTPLARFNQKLTCSLWLAAYEKGDGHGVVENADKALYSSKENGRNRTTIFSK
jgi:diguanylate cyclase (GGDEF)-like protein